jgi:hypothetical protein
MNLFSRGSSYAPQVHTESAICLVLSCVIRPLSVFRPSRTRDATRCARTRVHRVSHCERRGWYASYLVDVFNLAAAFSPAVCSMRTPKTTQEIIDGNLTTREKFWRDQQPWLKEAGYMLRARYQPDWVPSWVGTNKFSLSCEDGISPAVRALAPTSR